MLLEGVFEELLKGSGGGAWKGLLRGDVAATENLPEKLKSQQEPCRAGGGSRISVFLVRPPQKGVADHNRNRTRDAEPPDSRATVKMDGAARDCTAEIGHPCFLRGGSVLHFKPMESSRGGRLGTATFSEIDETSKSTRKSMDSSRVAV